MFEFKDYGQFMREEVNDKEKKLSLLSEKLGYIKNIKGSLRKIILVRRFGKFEKNKKT